MAIKKFLLLSTKFGETKQKTSQTKWKPACSSCNLIQILAGAVTLVAPVIPNVTTARHGGGDGTIVVPSTLKDSKGGTVKVTSVIKDAHGQVETNGHLAPGVHLVTFSADGYQDVTSGVSVTDHS